MILSDFIFVRPGGMAKRIFDVVASASGSVVLLPLYPLVALAIKLESPGPVFYLQDRVGRHGEIFRIIKFRSMVDGADRHGDITGPEDSRITRVGAILRRIKFDEMPSLLNVLKGDMSFVGPRPESPDIVANYTAEQRQVLSVRPGITDPATLYFDDEAHLMENDECADEGYVERILPTKLRLSFEYIQRRSFWFDLRIIFATLLLIIRRGRG